jgi:hypothetical protein
MRTGLHAVFLLASVVLGCHIAGCGPENAGGSVCSLEDAPLTCSQEQLLDLAFGAASAMPLDPHIKNRSRAQEAVVGACFELELPQRALRYIEQIENWRRGAGYADLAFFCARRDRSAEVRHYLDLAAQSAARSEDWRRDRIRTKIARVYAYLGEAEKAVRLQQGIAASEKGKVARAEAMVCSADAFEEKMESLAAFVSTKDFDLTRNALEAYAELFDRFYGDRARRSLVEERIKTSWESLPIFVRIDLLKELAGSALAHADRAKALALVNEAKAIMDSAQWQPRFAIPLTAQLAELRFRAGDEERARTEARAALGLFDAKRDTIVNIDRAGLLRPIAEAYQAMGETATALELYERAVEAGRENPNSRPRAEDLAATACSMAVHAVEPHAELWSRMKEIREGLGDPW